MPRKSAACRTVAAVRASPPGTPRRSKTRTLNSKSCSAGKSVVSGTCVTLALRKAGRLRFRAAVFHERHAVRHLAEAVARDGHAHLRARHVDLPREHGRGTDRAAAVVHLRLREEERVRSLDAAGAHVVPARERDDLTVGVREDGKLWLWDVPRRVL